MAGPAVAQLRDIDYDWMLVNIDTLLQDFAPSLNFPLAGVDNDGNGIRDEDSLALLGSILRGTHRVDAINPSWVSQIRSDFAYNRGAADNDLQAEGTNCSVLGYVGYPCRLTGILRMPGILPPGVGDDLADLLLDFFGGLATIADTPQTFNFINSYIDAIIDAFRDELDPSVQQYIDPIKADLHLQSGNYYRWGANGNRTNVLGANGNVDQDGSTNYTEYQSAGTNRETWLTNCTIIPPIHITGHPAGGNFLTGDVIALTVTFAGGEPGFTFQWQDAGDFPESLYTIPGATSQTYTIEYATSAVDDWKPWARCSDAITLWNTGIEGAGKGGRTSRFTEINVSYRSWAIHTQPEDGYAYPGDNFETTFGVWGGTNIPTYQWFKDGEGALAGQTTKTLSLTNLAIADTGLYWCEATNTEGTLVSRTLTLSVNDPMSILTQPMGGNYATGDNHTFTVVVDDGHPPYTYQWYRRNIGAGPPPAPPDTDGSAVGPDSGTWDILGLTFGQQGKYYCVITDMSGGQVATNMETTPGVDDPAPLRVLSIRQHPLPKDVKPGYPAIFEIMVEPGSGLPNDPPPEYTYQWYQWEVDGEGIPTIPHLIPGATETIYVVAAAQVGLWPTGDEGAYTCVVTDGAAVSLESAAATLVISADPIEFQVQPDGGRKYVGESHTFLVVVSGGTGNPFDYHWFKDEVALPGRTELTFTITSLILEDAGIYRCAVGELGVRPPLAYANSANAVLEVADPLTIEQEPLDANLYEGETFVADIGVSGGLGALRFQWFKGSVAIAGGTDSTYEISSVVLADADKYRCDVMDDRGIPLTTTFAWLSVVPAIAIDLEPVGGVYNANEAHTFTVAASGGVGALHYQWMFDNDRLGPNPAIEVGADASVLILGDMQEADSGLYSCVVTDGHLPESPVQSANADLTVDLPFAIPPEGQPQSAEVYEGSDHTFTMYSVGADGQVGYQWYFDDGGGPVAIPGAESSALLILDAGPEDEGLYSVVVTDAADPGNPITSASAQLTVAPQLEIVTDPAPQTADVGETVTFFVTINGGVGSIGYQWKRDGVDLADKTDSSLILRNVREEDGDYFYSCAVSDNFATVESAGAGLTINLGTPAAGVVALGLLAGAMAVAAAVAARRRR